MAMRPNILMIMADQLTALALPAYGHQVVRAPNLDRLASEGVLFEQAYCNFPLCAPSRASLMSGRLASRIEVYDNAAEFPASVPTMAHGLRAQGYRTCLAGKMHFVGPDQLHGFEERLTTDIYPADFGWTPNWDPARGADRLVVPQHGERSSRRASPRPPTSSTSTTRWRSRPGAGWPSTPASRTGGRSSCACRSPTRTTPTRCRAPTGIATATSEIDLPACGRARRRGRAQPPADGVWPTWRRSRSPRPTCAARVTPIMARSPTSTTRSGGCWQSLDRFGLGQDTIVMVTADHGEMLGERGLWYKMHFFEWACACR